MQCLLGADIQMVLDECTPFPATREEAKTSLDLSLRWAERCKAAFATRAAPGQALFGIVQGGIYPDLREQSAACAARDRLRRLCGRRARGRRSAGRHARHGRDRDRILPADRPRYLMGVGTPDDLLLCDRARYRHVRLRDADPLRPPLARPSPGAGGSICATRAMPRTRRRSTPKAPVPPPDTSGPICIIWCARARRSAPCCSATPTCSSIRS